jgi:hypothetical protein
LLRRSEDGEAHDFAAGACERAKPITAFREEGHIYRRGLTMTAKSGKMEPQFENPEVSKLEDETLSDASPREQMDRIAEELAEKSSKIEKDSGEERSIFTK